MNVEKTRPMVVLLLALLVTLVSREAQAGFIRPRVTFPTPGIHSGLLGLPDGSVDTASLAGMNSFDGGRSSRPIPGEESDDRPVFNPPGRLANSDGACDTEPSSQSSGSANLAIYNRTSPIRDRVALARLPDEMGPHFSNPPRSTPLRPPCRWRNGVEMEAYCRIVSRDRRLICAAWQFCCLF